MNLSDPARGDPPKLFWNNRPVGALPGIYIDPEQKGWRASVCVMIAHNTARWLHFSGDNTLEELLELYRNDPEQTLTDRFGWTYNAEATSRRPRGLTLADLGEL